MFLVLHPSSVLIRCSVMTQSILRTVNGSNVNATDSHNDPVETNDILSSKKRSDEQKRFPGFRRLTGESAAHLLLLSLVLLSPFVSHFLSL